MLVLFLSLLFSLYAIGYLYRCYKIDGLTAPHALYSFLVLLHFILPGVLIGLDAAPAFVNFKNEEYVMQAVLYSGLALIAIQAGSNFAISKKFAPSSVAQVRNSGSFQWLDFKIVIITVALLGAGWLARIYTIQSDAYFQLARTTNENISDPFYAAIRMVEVFPLQVICLLAIRYWRPSSNKSIFWRNYLYISIFMEAAYWLPSGRKESLILAIVLPLIIRYVRTKQLPSRKFTFAFISFVIMMFPAMYFYRVTAEQSGGIYSIADVIAAITGAASDSSQFGKSGWDIIFGRFSLLEPIAACIRILNDQIWEPFYGLSYFQGLLGFIPRFVWPGKPDLHYGNDFGYYAGYLSERDLVTSISVTFFGESYLNFAYLGLIPLLFIGYVFGYIYRKTFASKHIETWLLLYTVLIPTILYVGGTFALYFGGLIKLLPFFYIIGRFMEGRKLHVTDMTPKIPERTP
jgi:hypothetical protein